MFSNISQKRRTFSFACHKKAFDLMGDDTVEVSTENEALKNKRGPYDEKCLEESKTKLLKQIDDEKRANFFMFRMKKQMIKQF